MPAGKPNIGLLSSSIISLRSAQSDGNIEDPVLSKISELAIGMIGITNYLVESHEVKIEINEEYNLFEEIISIKEELSNIVNNINENSSSLANELEYMNQTMKLMWEDIVIIKDKIESE